MSAQVDASDPQVRKLVYNMYRNILGAYNDKANGIVGQLPAHRVTLDKGISDQLESMIRQSSQISGNCSPGPGSPPVGAPMGAPPPPPPPMGASGSIPSVRIPTDVGPKRYEPPAAIQNAMMTKDKKPFTYTPGGLDLNEIRSPRMQRRINRNANTEDSCTGAQPRPSPLAQGQQLPPAAMHAMQPQIAVPVFPPGGPPPPPPPPPGPGSAPPPPPPPPPSNAPPPPPMPFRDSQDSAPRPPPMGRPDFLADIEKHPPLKPVSQMGRPPPDFISEIPNHAPLKPVHFGQRPNQNQAPAMPNSVQLKPAAPRPAPPAQEPPLYSLPQPIKVEPPSYSLPQPIKVEPPSYSLPQPIKVEPPSYSLPQPVKITPKSPEEVLPPPPPKPKVQQPLYIPPNDAPSMPVKQTPPSPANLNKSPAPWLTTQRSVQKDVPPWACRDSQEKVFEEKQVKEEKVSTSSSMTRIIPIHIEGRDLAPVQSQVQEQRTQSISTKQETTVTQGRTRIIPIQIEGAESRPPVQRQSSQTQQQWGPQPRFTSQSPQTVGSPVPDDPRMQRQQSWLHGPPTQSRSFRVLQKITGSEDSDDEGSRMFFFPGGFDGMQPPGTFLVNRVLPPDREDVGDSNGRPDESEY